MALDIELIEKEWAEDSQLELTDLGNETKKTVQLHSKYYRWYRQAVFDAEKQKQLRARLVKLKTEYYMGELDKETLDKHGWKQCQKRYIKTELPMILAADRDIINADLGLVSLNITVDFLESVIKSINNRGFHIRNVVEYMKFTNGSN